MASRKSVTRATSRSRQPKRAKVDPPILASARLMDRVLAFDALLPDPFAPIGRPAGEQRRAERVSS